MFKNLKKTFAVLAFSALFMTSCVNKEDIKNRLDNLEDRISKLEDAIGATNANALAASTLLKENTLILGYEKTEYGYIFSFDGGEVEIIFGTQAPGIIPIVGVDTAGNWIMSLDGGQSWSKIAGSSNAFCEEGATPQVKVDADGYWCISLDGGKTWSQIKDGAGKPISATDGKEMAGKKTFFTALELGENQVTLTLANGQTVTIPVASNFFINLKGYTEGAQIAKGATLEYEVETSGVASAAIQTPSGWEAVLTDTSFSVTAPSKGENGIYTIGITAVSDKGTVKQFDYTFTLN
ncbi:MAG: PL29 family lyase N-terminal domain-containing protein [Candidatus Cryptobacteroides sp.]